MKEIYSSSSPHYCWLLLCPNCDAGEIELMKTGTMVVFDKFRCKKCNFTWHKT